MKKNKYLFAFENMEEQIEDKTLPSDPIDAKGLIEIESVSGDIKDLEDDIKSIGIELESLEEVAGEVKEIVEQQKVNLAALQEENDIQDEKVDEGLQEDPSTNEGESTDGGSEEGGEGDMGGDPMSEGSEGSSEEGESSEEVPSDGESTEESSEGSEGGEEGSEPVEKLDENSSTEEIEQGEKSLESRMSNIAGRLGFESINSLYTALGVSIPQKFDMQSARRDRALAIANYKMTCEGIGESLGKFFKAIWDGIKKFFSKIWEFIKSIFSSEKKTRDTIKELDAQLDKVDEALKKAEGDIKIKESFTGVKHSRVWLFKCDKDSVLRYCKELPGQIDKAIDILNSDSLFHHENKDASAIFSTFLEKLNGSQYGIKLLNGQVLGWSISGFVDLSTGEKVDVNIEIPSSLSVEEVRDEIRSLNDLAMSVITANSFQSKALKNIETKLDKFFKSKNSEFFGRRKDMLMEISKLSKFSLGLIAGAAKFQDEIAYQSKMLMASITYEVEK